MCQRPPPSGPSIRGAQRPAPTQPRGTRGSAVAHAGPPPGTPLATPFRLLWATGRGKHVGRLSYYHLSLVSRVAAAAAELGTICSTFHGTGFAYNVVKLDAGYRVSFLRYETFTAAFPALLAALTCDLGRGAARRTDYAARRNPPILHRKELLLPADHPLVPDAVRLTERLERLGAFRDTRRIGTRAGWERNLASLAIRPDGSSA